MLSNRPSVDGTSLNSNEGPPVLYSKSNVDDPLLPRSSSSYSSYLRYIPMTYLSALNGISGYASLPNLLGRFIALSPSAQIASAVIGAISSSGLSFYFFYQLGPYPGNKVALDKKKKNLEKMKLELNKAHLEFDHRLKLYTERISKQEGKKIKLDSEIKIQITNNDLICALKRDNVTRSSKLPWLLSSILSEGVNGASGGSNLNAYVGIMSSPQQFIFPLTFGTLSAVIPYLFYSGVSRFSSRFSIDLLKQEFKLGKVFLQNLKKLYDEKTKLLDRFEKGLVTEDPKERKEKAMEEKKEADALFDPTNENEPSVEKPNYFSSITMHSCDPIPVGSTPAEKYKSSSYCSSSTTAYLSTGVEIASILLNGLALGFSFDIGAPLIVLAIVLFLVLLYQHRSFQSELSELKSYMHTETDRMDSNEKKLSSDMKKIKLQRDILDAQLQRGLFEKKSEEKINYSSTALGGGRTPGARSPQKG